MPARTLLMAPPAAAGGAFDPETDITWHSLFWAEGTDFVAQGYSDTDSVGTWPNETGETDATQSTEANRPIYDSANTTMNSQPCVTNDGAASSGLQAASFSVNPSYTSGVSIVVIGYWVSDAADQSFCSGEYYNRNNRIFVLGADNLGIECSTPRWGDPAVTGTAGSPLCLVGFFDGGAGEDELIYNGTKQTLTGTNSGAEQLQGFSVFGDHTLSQNLEGGISLIGIYEGDITADGSWADFETWVSDHYGITIA